MKNIGSCCKKIKMNYLWKFIRCLIGVTIAMKASYFILINCLGGILMIRRLQEVKDGISWEEAPDILSMRQAGELLGCGYHAIRARIIRGMIPHVKVGNSIKISKAALWSWFNQEAESNVHPKYR